MQPPVEGNEPVFSLGTPPTRVPRRNIASSGSVSRFSWHSMVESAKGSAGASEHCRGLRPGANVIQGRGATAGTAASEAGGERVHGEALGPRRPAAARRSRSRACVRWARNGVDAPACLIELGARVGHAARAAPSPRPGPAKSVGVRRRQAPGRRRARPADEARPRGAERTTSCWLDRSRGPSGTCTRSRAEFLDRHASAELKRGQRVGPCRAYALAFVVRDRRARLDPCRRKFASITSRVAGMPAGRRLVRAPVFPARAGDSAGRRAPPRRSPTRAS